MLVQLKPLLQGTIFAIHQGFFSERNKPFALKTIKE